MLEAVSDVKSASLYSRLSVLKKHGVLQQQRENVGALVLLYPCLASGCRVSNPFRKARVAIFIDASPQ